MNICIYLYESISCNSFFGKEIFQTNFIGTENKTHFYVPQLYPKILPYMICAKYGRVGQATDENTAHSFCILDN